MKRKVITDDNLYTTAYKVYGLSNHHKKIDDALKKQIPLFLESNGNLFEINEANLIINEEKNNLPLVYFSLKTK